MSDIKVTDMNTNQEQPDTTQRGILRSFAEKIAELPIKLQHNSAKGTFELVTTVNGINYAFTLRDAITALNAMQVSLDVMRWAKRIAAAVREQKAIVGSKKAAASTTTKED